MRVVPEPNKQRLKQIILKEYGFKIEEIKYINKGGV
ncbi:unnamed protein product, partial [marine sediment metagenome]